MKLPQTPLSSSAIADFLQVSKPTIADYYKKITRAYHWMDENQLVIGSGNKRQYTPFCIEKMELLSTCKNHEQWISEVQSSYSQDSINFADAEIIEEPSSFALVKPEYIPVEIQELNFNIPVLDLTDIDYSTGQIIQRLNHNLDAAPTAFREKIVQKYRLAGKIIAQQAFTAMSEEINTEMQRLVGEP